jgi:ABC-type Mn2+/Zn2+ transport system permease subunit
VTIGVIAPVVGLSSSYWLIAASGATIGLGETALFLVVLLGRLQMGRRREAAEPAT